MVTIGEEPVALCDASTGTRRSRSVSGFPAVPERGAGLCFGSRKGAPETARSDERPNIFRGVIAWQERESLAWRS